MNYITKSGFSISENEIAEILKEWGTDIQSGEQYSIVSIAHLMIAIVNNIKDQNIKDGFIRCINNANPDQKKIICNLNESLKYNEKL